jgi:hypothetical protein
MSQDQKQFCGSRELQEGVKFPLAARLGHALNDPLAKIEGVG